MLFLNFSDRPAGNCGSVAALCSQMLGGQVVNVSELFTQGCGACQTDCFQKDGACPLPDAPAITALYEAITAQAPVLSYRTTVIGPVQTSFAFANADAAGSASAQNAPSAILPPKNILSSSAIQTVPILKKSFRSMFLLQGLLIFCFSAPLHIIV